MAVKRPLGTDRTHGLPDDLDDGALHREATDTATSVPSAGLEPRPDGPRRPPQDGTVPAGGGLVVVPGRRRVVSAVVFSVWDGMLSGGGRRESGSGDCRDGGGGSKTARFRSVSVGIRRATRSRRRRRPGAGTTPAEAIRRSTRGHTGASVRRLCTAHTVSAAPQRSAATDPAIAQGFVVAVVSNVALVPKLRRPQQEFLAMARRAGVLCQPRPARSRYAGTRDADGVAGPSGAAPVTNNRWTGDKVSAGKTLWKVGARGTSQMVRKPACVPGAGAGPCRAVDTGPGRMRHRSRHGCVRAQRFGIRLTQW